MDFGLSQSAMSLNAGDSGGLQKSASAPAMTLTDAFGNEVKRYQGQLQQTLPRLGKNPPVKYDKGGSDFRCPHHEHTTSMGRQVLAWPHTSSSGSMRFTVHPRFVQAPYRSPGPKFGSPSSIGKQPASGRPSLPAYGFGTSTRDGALKQYAVWSFR